MSRRLLDLADRIALRKLITELPTKLSWVVDRIGRLATGGKLWLGVAGGLSLAGSRGRTAARNGLVAYGVTSGLANGPLKWITSRQRPRGLLLAGLPRLGRSPSTSSFPSAHTASAAAFTVAAGFELPAVAPALVAATTAVALQRMKAVRHYPTDVIGGVVIGVAVGASTAFCSRRLRGAGHYDPAVAHPAGHRLRSGTKH